MQAALAETQDKYLELHQHQTEDMAYIDSLKTVLLQARESNRSLEQEVESLRASELACRERADKAERYGDEMAMLYRCAATDSALLTSSSSSSSASRGSKRGRDSNAVAAGSAVWGPASLASAPAARSHDDLQAALRAAQERETAQEEHIRALQHECDKKDQMLSEMRRSTTTQCELVATHRYHEALLQRDERNKHMLLMSERVRAMREPLEAEIARLQHQLHLHATPTSTPMQR